MSDDRPTLWLSPGLRPDCPRCRVIDSGRAVEFCAACAERVESGMAARRGKPGPSVSFDFGEAD